jgi:hypothetical protein
MGELGALQLVRRQYYEALDTLLHSGYWSDAAYVAEYVLTADELAAYVERQWALSEPGDADPNEANPEQLYYWSGNVFPGATRTAIRYLTGRRLARLQRWDEAADFYPSRWRARLVTFVDALQRGQDESLAREARAEALWQAAQIARHEGMELFGTEVEPDWQMFGGQYDWSHVSQLRGASPDENGIRRIEGFPWFEREIPMKLTASSLDEQRRLGRHKPTPNARFHYRYTAAELAWEAAQLMPDNSEATARVLWTAGTWMKTRDPLFADRFYKALVRRCGVTILGQEADRLRWFPKTETPVVPEPQEVFEQGEGDTFEMEELRGDEFDIEEVQPLEESEGP